MVARKIWPAAIRDVDGPGLNGSLIKDIDIMNFSHGHDHYRYFPIDYEQITKLFEWKLTRHNLNILFNKIKLAKSVSESLVV